MSKIVEEYYDHTSDYEDIRLKQDAYHQLEFLVTMHYLEKYLPKKGHILDLGCGTGAYSVPLAKKGYDLSLVDLSRKSLDLAEKNLKKNKLWKKVKALFYTSAENLSMFPDNTFDAVLCFGPMYHLINLSDRKKVIKEIKRVSKKNAKIFVSVISYYGVLKRVIVKYPHELTSKNHKRMFEEGIHVARWHGKKIEKINFPDAKFYKPDELKKFMESFKFKTLEMFACEGLSSHLQEATNNLYKSRKRWKKWFDLIIKYSNEPSILGSTQHFVWVGRK